MLLSGSHLYANHPCQKLVAVTQGAASRVCRTAASSRPRRICCKEMQCLDSNQFLAGVTCMQVCIHPAAGLCTYVEPKLHGCAAWCSSSNCAGSTIRGCNRAANLPPTRLVSLALIDGLVQVNGQWFDAHDSSTCRTELDTFLQYNQESQKVCRLLKLLTLSNFSNNFSTYHATSILASAA